MQNEVTECYHDLSTTSLKLRAVYKLRSKCINATSNKSHFYDVNQSV